MDGRKPIPGVSREQRLSDQGLQRLERQLKSKTRISDRVLAQWVKRYGEPARELLKKYGRYDSELG
ncbi:hypothetical protein BOW53_14375 [Solemya pervernicosa gill symbiont]|uniref:Uncharacterized protein n=2 Tax=Gammaproteobacteria incertae sedis TaxID=118884 RepID=A0A1T2L0S6_9GAMM|nr:hypothetical protein [Candidatus Reidiella endopervernicosa]OOZ38707.1 hypothetical protein BOW53_14375 [Solemya pervernicosa gill symbiont]QKQ25817.1 hypothetical protein HUE57_05630 [Candidatus Reidiella endopervernicosa]